MLGLPQTCSQNWNHNYCKSDHCPCWRRRKWSAFYTGWLGGDTAAGFGDVDEKICDFSSPRDAGRCKAAARSARQLEGRGTSAFAKLQTHRFEEVEILSSTLGGWRDLPQDECWFMTRVRVDEFHLIFPRKMWFVCNGCGSRLHDSALSLKCAFLPPTRLTLPPKKYLSLWLIRIGWINSKGQPLASGSLACC